MADSVVDKVETEVVEKEKEKEKPKVEEKNDDAKSENGEANAKENGEKSEAEDEPKDAENGDAEEVADACKVKRKSASGGGDATDNAQAEGASPEKKAKLDEKLVEGESNGGEAKAAA